MSCVLVIIKNGIKSLVQDVPRLLLRHILQLKKNLVEMIHLFSLFANSQISNCQIEW